MRRMGWLRLLGPPGLGRDRHALALAVRKTWALLTLLAVDGTAPRERLAARLWPDLPAETARRNLRRELARLREAGAPGLVRADGEHLALDDGVDCDLRRLREAVAAGDDEAVATLGAGVLAEGLQLDEVPDFGDWLQRRREGLQQQRLQALQRLAAAAEARGDLGTAWAHAQTLLQLDPLQEQHHRLAMRLLAARGERAAALAQYERCRMLLAGELDLEPMAETRALAQRLRGDDPADGTPAPSKDGETAAPPGNERAAPALAALERVELPAAPPFTGREAEAAQLEQAWQAGRCVVVEGAAGIGKTRLAMDFAAARGACARVACRPGDAGVPYAAFARALRTFAGVDGASPGALQAALADAVPRWVLPELARVLPELGLPPPLLAAPEERARFHEACALAWQRLTQDSFDLVVVDDWHWADLPSQGLLAHIVRRGADAASIGERSPAARHWWLLRPGELGDAARAVLRTLPAALRLRLAPLDEAQVAALLQALAGGVQAPRFARRLHQACGGQPFFIVQTLRHLAELGLLQADDQGRWHTPYDEATEDYRELPLPADVLAAVRERVQRLGEAPRRLLEAASLCPEPFVASALAAACALSEVEALQALDAALAARLLREVAAEPAPGALRSHAPPAAVAGFAFVHDLVRQAMAGALGPARARLLHRRLALGALAAGLAPAQVAAHWEAAGEPARALPLRMAAAEAAERLGAGEQALIEWTAALADAPAPAQALQIQTRRLQLLRAAAELPQADRALAAIAEALDDGRLPPSARADAALAAAAVHIERDETEAAAAMLQRAQALLLAVDDAASAPARLALLHARLAAAQGRLDEGHAIAAAALAGAGLDLPLRAALLEAMAGNRQRRGAVAEARAQARELLALADRGGDLGLQARARELAGTLALAAGEREQAERELLAARQLCAELRWVERQRAVLLNLLRIEAERGAAARALALADEGWQLSPHFTQPALRLAYLQAYVYLHGLAGDLGAALQRARQALAAAQALGTPEARLATALKTVGLLVLLGRGDEALATLAEVQALPVPELAALRRRLAMAEAMVAVRAGDPALARVALQRVGPPMALDLPQDRLFAAIAAADLALLDGRADEVPSLIAAWLLPDQGAEADRPTTLAADLHRLRLRALLACEGRVPGPLREAAARCLAEGGMPALESLELRDACIAAARADGDGAALDALEAGRSAELQALGATLVALPEERERFLAYWAARAPR